MICRLLTTGLASSPGAVHVKGTVLTVARIWVWT
jgi:hypothetical protein